MTALRVPDVRPAVVPEGPTLQEILRPENLLRSERSSEKRGWITRVFTDDVYELDGVTVVDRTTEDRHYIPDFGRFGGDPGRYTVEGRWHRYHIPRGRHGGGHQRMRPQTSALEQAASQHSYMAMRLAMQALFPDRDRPIALRENPDGTFSARLQTPTDYR